MQQMETKAMITCIWLLEKKNGAEFHEMLGKEPNTLVGTSWASRADCEVSC